ncbi:hypothetical protein ABE66_17025 [Cytobacillus firmus]|nr:hypothetical protein [Cytobacillus firmus]
MAKFIVNGAMPLESTESEERKSAGSRRSMRSFGVISEQIIRDIQKAALRRAAFLIKGKEQGIYGD